VTIGERPRVSRKSLRFLRLGTQPSGRLIRLRFLRPVPERDAVAAVRFRDLTHE
jgi:hypothetical protein